MPLHKVPAAEIDFSRDIQPLLARKCFACHGPDTQEAGLTFHERDLAIKVLDSETQAIVPGKPSASEMLLRVRETDPDLRMPPAEHPALTGTEIAKLEQWILEGAEYTAHWAFEPIRTVDVPSATSPEASANPIDRFVDAKLQTQHLTAAPTADRRTLIRRLSYNLRGLPPTAEEVDEFVTSDDPQAWENLIDRYLASPQYGEKWARHWLDVVRYAETNSFERDSTKPNAWKYRDYVIRSFNEDKPYDQFLREQLAGDEFDETTIDSITATAFYRLGIWDDEPADPLLARYDELDSIVTTIGQGMLGLTLNCSRCHDHKIDPIPQADYYKMVAFLQGLTPYGKRNDQQSYSQTDVSSPGLKERYENIEKQLGDLRYQMHDLEQMGVVKMPAEDQRKSETRERNKLLNQKLKNFLEPDQWAEYETLQQQEKQLQEDRKHLPPRQTVLSVAEVNARPEATHIMLRGNPHVPGDQVGPGFPELFEAAEPTIAEVSPEARSSGRRKVLADWVTSSENRLTSRVMVNRIWQNHFGRGIVRSSNNFGLMGTPPTHPELLDWLAHEFVQSGWKMKPLHRLILTSQAYQRASVGPAESLAADPTNDYFWRFDLRRLSAEELRDSVLQVAGNLNEQMFGPSIYPPLSKEVLSTQSRPGEGWGKSSPEQQHRRSIYIFIKRSLIPPELATFDFPETDVTCEARFVTIQPAQSLNMINGDFLNRQAQVFAASLTNQQSDNANWSTLVEQGYLQAIQRVPSADEQQAALDLIDRLEQTHGLNPEQRRHYFCLFLLNLNEFMFVD